MRFHLCRTLLSKDQFLVNLGLQLASCVLGFGSRDVEGGWEAVKMGVHRTQEIIGRVEKEISNNQGHLLGPQASVFFPIKWLR